MRIVVCGPEPALKEAGITNRPECIVVNTKEEFYDYPGYDAYINFYEDALSYDYKNLFPVLVNSVIETLPESSEHIYRINGWPGFLQRDTWEISGRENEKVNSALSTINKKPIWLKDEPGFVSARVISMVINEAFFALEDKVSTREEIDTAMKLGTGYPFGPFEWAEKIGTEKIAKLLQYLSFTDARYNPSVLLSGHPVHP